MNSTNKQIAILLQQQTYAEREEMAASFRDMTLNAADNTPPDEMDLDWFMHTLQYWSEAELTDEAAA